MTPYHELRDRVTIRHPGAYCAGSFETGTCLIIVPARTLEEATTGSGILAIGETEYAAWVKGADVVKAEADARTAVLRARRKELVDLPLLDDTSIQQPDPVTSESYLPVLIGATVARTAGTEFYPRPLFLNQLAAEIHRHNVHWWSDPATGKRIERNVHEMLMLMVSEISEGLEGYRKNLMDDKLTHRRMLEVEIADLFIRGFDLAGGLGLDLDGAVAEKRLFNSTRADHTNEARLGANGKKF